MPRYAGSADCSQARPSMCAPAEVAEVQSATEAGTLSGSELSKAVSMTVSLTMESAPRSTRSPPAGVASTTTTSWPRADHALPSPSAVVLAPAPPQAPRTRVIGGIGSGAGTGSG